MSTLPTEPLSAAQQAAMKKEQRDRVAQEDGLNDARAEQQMIEGALNTDASVGRLEQDRRSGGAAHADPP